MRVAVVFDASAVVAYARASIAVGEVLVEIADARDDGEQVCVAVPAASLLAAVAGPSSMASLRRLAAHPAVTVISTRYDEALPAARLAAQLGIPGEAGAAAYLAIRNDAQLLTGRAGKVRESKNLDIASRVINIEDDFRD